MPPNRPNSLLHARRPRAFTLIELLVTIGILCLLLAILIPVFFRCRESARSATCLANLRQIGAAMTMYTSDSDGSFPPATTDAFAESGKNQVKGISWRQLITPYLGDKADGFPACPDRELPGELAKKDANPIYCGYAWNLNLTHATTLRGPAPTHSFNGKMEQKVSYPSLTVAVLEARTGITAANEPDGSKETANYEAIAPSHYIELIRAQSPAGLRQSGGANYLFADSHVRWYAPAAIATAPISDGVHPGMGL